MIETGRDYWMRVYAGRAMQALIGKEGFDETKPRHVDSLAEHAVAISKALLDKLEATRGGWIEPRFTGSSLKNSRAADRAAS